MLVRRWAWRGAAASAGGLLALAFPAPSLWWLAWWALVPLILLCAHATSYRDAAWRAGLASVAFFGVHLHWLVPKLGVLAVVPALVVFAMWVPFGLATRWLLAPPRSVRRVVAALLVLPAVWVTVEFVRSWHGLGGPWGLLGLSQWRVPAVLQVVALGGVWLLSAILVAVNVGLAVALGGGRARSRFIGAATALALAAVTIMFGHSRSDPPVSGTMRVAGVQPGLIHDVDRRFARHLELTRSLRGAGQDLVVWGQLSVGFDPSRHPGAVRRLSAAAAVAGSDVLVNADDHTAGGGLTRDTKQYGPRGLIERYSKRRLVPFGEFVPLRPLFGWVSRYTAAAVVDRVSGSGSTVLDINGRRVGPLISYESLFADLRRQLARRGVDLTVVQGSLTSFQGSWAHAAQASIEAVRAVESGRPAVLVEMSGTSAAFDARGRRLVWRPPGHSGVFTVDIPLSTERTPYVRYGDWVPALAIALVLLSAAVAVVRGVSETGDHSAAG